MELAETTVAGEGEGQEQGRVVGDYILGPRIGFGSFAVVWRARHRQHGHEVAMKEIDEKQVDSKVRDGLLKEITILRRISHPNIVRLYHAIQTEDKIFLVLEHCAGGDLAAYMQRHGTHGRVSADVARHFMRQLAEGLKVLRENNLIHRDLKPQNLLLSTSDETAVLKIGDFGFARYLMPERLADTLCGSPLYMAPEIIQDRKYDAKADLWSVGAILFQLVTGKLPFDGNTHYQLFQNIMASDELQFPQDVLVSLHPDCINLCRRLLRRNPVERLAFEEFFNHNFMATPRITESTIESENTPDVDLGDAGPSNSSNVSNSKIASMEKGFSCIKSLRVADSLEFIEQEYVLVHANFASMETLSPSLEPSLYDNTTTKIPSYRLKTIEKGYAGTVQSGELAMSSIYGAESKDSHVPALLPVSQASPASEDLQETSSLHHSSRIQLLSQYINVLTELAHEKFYAGLHLESFSVELVILAVWSETLQLCDVWMTSSNDGDSLHSFSMNDYQSQKRDYLCPNITEEVDFTKPLLVCSWAKRGFVIACDRAEALSNCFGDTNGDVEMPDAMEVIFQKALTVGKFGAVEELMGHWSSAVASYSKAITFLAFIVVEAKLLPLSSPFALSSLDQQRLQRYIASLRTRLKMSQMAEILFRQTIDSSSK